jgi:hypothetical protein
MVNGSRRKKMAAYLIVEQIITDAAKLKNIGTRSDP